MLYVTFMYPACRWVCNPLRMRHVSCRRLYHNFGSTLQSILQTFFTCLYSYAWFKWERCTLADMLCCCPLLWRNVKWICRFIDKIIILGFCMYPANCVCGDTLVHVKRISPQILKSCEGNRPCP
jgi:hypothetical protein